MRNKHSRRDFLRTAAAGLATGPLATSLGAATGEIPYRDLGNTGEKVSLVGLGGAHIGYDYVTERDALRIMHAAIDGGINFFDNSWDYNRGVSEERMGKALAMDGKRQKVFLMTKVCCHREGWTKRAALAMLDQSLQRLRTDHLDLWQIHEVIESDHPEKAYQPESAIEALDEAKRSGKVRFVGFTGHRDPAIHLKMISLGYSFDTVQMPLNVMDAHFRSFEKQVLPVLKEKGMGAIGMKPLGGGREVGAIPDTGSVSALECLHYAMNLPVSTVVTGIPSMQVLEQALQAAGTSQKLSNQEVNALLARTQPLAAHGEFERYKTG